MAEIKKVNESNFNDNRDVSLKVSLAQESIHDFFEKEEPEEIDDNLINNLGYDFSEEIIGDAFNRVAEFSAGWLANAKNLLYSNVDVSLATAESISNVAWRAVRVLPVVSLILPPAWETFKYTVIEGEGTEGIANHKYEITGAAVGGAVSAVAVSAVLASNPVGWVTAGVIGVCVVGSIALENIGAYYDSHDVEPVDYMSNVYFY